MQTFLFTFLCLPPNPETTTLILHFLFCVIHTHTSLLFNFACIWCLLKGHRNYGNNKKISGCQGSSGGEREIGRAQDFQGSKTTLHDTIMMDTCHYTFIQTYWIYSTKSEPYCNLWSLDYYDVSMYVHQLYQVYHSGMLGKGEAMHMWRPGIYFTVNL